MSRTASRTNSGSVRVTEGRFKVSSVETTQNLLLRGADVGPIFHSNQTIRAPAEEESRKSRRTDEQLSSWADRREQSERRGYGLEEVQYAHAMDDRNLRRHRARIAAR